MKMAKWILEDRVAKGVGEVYILKGEPLEESKEREIYQTPDISFKLIYSPQEKMIGYLLNYRYDQIFPKYSLFNSFGIVYNEKPSVAQDDLSFEVIFEDQVVRLLAYLHPDDVMDFMLVGRWRSTNTDKIIDERPERV